MTQITSQEGGPEVVIARLKAGADPGARANDGMTARDLVMDGGADPELVTVLEGR